MADTKDLGPLTWNVPIVDAKSGRPSPEFQRRWEQQRANNDVFGTPPFGYTMSVFDIAANAGKIIRISVDVDWTFPAVNSTPAGTASGKVQNGPSVDTDFIIQHNGSNIAIVRFVGGGTTATLIKGGDSDIVARDYLDVLVPSTLNGMSGPWSMSIVGVRT